MIYGDTSFVLALYLRFDPFHAQAIRVAVRLREPLPLTLLGELELLNGVRRTLADKIINLQTHDAIFRQLESDLSEGIFVRQPLPQVAHYTKALELSRKFTPELSTRSLDILHVAAALLLGAVNFASFDGKQRQLAEKAGLKILPAKISPRKSF